MHRLHEELKSEVDRAMFGSQNDLRALEAKVVKLEEEKLNEQREAKIA